MKSSAEIAGLTGEIRSRLNQLSETKAAAVRSVRREFSRRITKMEPENVLELAVELLGDDSDLMRFFAYELLNNHRPALAGLRTNDLLRLGNGIGSWVAVDCFAMFLTGPVWARGGVPDKTVAGWAGSDDRWWRTALVSTVALSRRGGLEDVTKVKRVCRLLVADRDDMVVKALSWALRELAKKHPDDAEEFMAEHGDSLAARVRREVGNKLRTGLKSGRVKRIAPMPIVPEVP
jgi:3-methyladenine DNA glycosylase AlkD